MAGRVASSMDKQGLVARTVTLKLRFADFTTLTRSLSLERATASVSAIHTTARELLDANWAPGQPVRLVGVGVSNLRPLTTPGQLPLLTVES